MSALQHGSRDCRELQILVVGTGVAGLTTAVALRGHGFDPVVVAGADPERPPTLTLWRTAVGHLERLGVAEPLSAATGVRQWVQRSHEGIDERFVHDAPHEPPPCLRARRGRIRGALAEATPSNRLRVGTTVQRLERRPSRTIVTFDDGVRERFDLVVGADGPDSRLRAVGPDSPSDGNTGSPDGRAPVEGTATVPPRLSARETVYEFRSHGGPLIRVGPLPDADTWRYVGSDGTGAVSVGVERWAVPGVALVGTAAHPLPPTVTTGTSLAVEDAVTLAGVLASRPTPRAALRTYERRRRHRLDDLYGPSRLDGVWSTTTLRECRRTFLYSAFD